MALRNQPYIPLYVQDFMSDEKLRECSAASVGVYIFILCLMHKSKKYGCILLEQKDKQTVEQLTNFALKLVRHLPYSKDTIKSALSDLILNEVLQITSNALIQKRMKHDGEVSQQRSKAGKAGVKAKQKKHKDFAQAKDQAKGEQITEIETVNEYEYVNDYLTHQQQKELLLYWIDYRKEIKKPLKSKKTITALAKKISQYGYEYSLKVIYYSVENGYQGLFFDKATKQINNQTQNKSAAQLWKELITS